MDRIFLVFLFALLLFVTPFTAWWSSPGMPWYLPFVLWLAVIGLAAWAQIRRGRHEP